MTQKQKHYKPCAFKLHFTHLTANMGIIIQTRKHNFFGIKTEAAIGIDLSLCSLKVEIYVENSAFVKY